MVVVVGRFGGLPKKHSGGDVVVARGQFGRVAAADQLVVDPVAAAQRLLGATLVGRGVQRGRRGGRGLRRGARRSLAGRGGPLLSRAQRPERRDVRPARAALHLPQPRDPRVRQRLVRTRRHGRRGPAQGRRHRGGRRRRARPVEARRSGRVALARGPGNLCSALGITMDDNGIDLFDPDSPVTLTLNEPLTAAVRSRGSGSARPPTGRGASGWRGDRRCRHTGEVRGRRRPVPATKVVRDVF